MKKLFRDRKQAGRLLASQLKNHPNLDRKNSLILALPRGGVPVALEVSNILDIPLDILIVRKIGHPYQPEYGIGAITEDGYYWTDKNVIAISEAQPAQIEEVIAKEKLEVLRRIKLYRKNRPLTSVYGKNVILIDDGLATGVTARVAAQYIKKLGAKKIILAVPICPDGSAHAMPSEIDEVVCFHQSSSLLAVGNFYEDFEQVTDNKVIELLNKSLKKQKETFI